MTTTTEIAPGVFRISTYVPEADLQFNQFLVRDAEPLLFHTGTRALFPAVHQAVASLIDPRDLAWIAFSHFEADECGSLREWQQAAPRATALCSLVGKLVSVDDVVAERPARALADGETLATGEHRFRFLQTPQVPHGWDAGLLYEERTGTLFCSDLFHQTGPVEALTESDVVGRSRQVLLQYQTGPFADYLPHAPRTGPTLDRLAALQPRVLAAMHGSAFAGDGARALRDLARVLEEVFGAR
jgi:flavorubredoxin